MFLRSCLRPLRTSFVIFTFLFLLPSSIFLSCKTLRGISRMCAAVPSNRILLPSDLGTGVTVCVVYNDQTRFASQERRDTLTTPDGDIMCGPFSRQQFHATCVGLVQLYVHNIYLRRCQCTNCLVFATIPSANGELSGTFTLASPLSTRRSHRGSRCAAAASLCLDPRRKRALCNHPKSADVALQCCPQHDEKRFQRELLHCSGSLTTKKRYQYCRPRTREAACFFLVLCRTLFLVDMNPHILARCVLFFEGV